MAEYGLVDIFREFHPTDKKYSWKQWGAHKFGRLDYFLVSNSLTPYVQKVDFLPKCYSDHSPILLDLDFSKFSRGRGFWKMNNSLLYDPEYVDEVKNTIKEVTTQYAIIYTVEEPNINRIFNDQTPESLQTLQLKINPELFLDCLLMEIRRVTILFSAKKKRERIAEEQLLNHDIEILENRLQEKQTADNHIDTELQEKRAALESIVNYQAQGAFIRSRASYKVEGERPTRLFCALEKYNGTQKYVPQLFITEEDGTEKLVVEQKVIEGEICSFYEDLYSCKDNLLEIDSVTDFLGNANCLDIPKLTEIEKDNLEGKITVEEMTKYLKRSKNNVAPGSSGFTNVI